MSSLNVESCECCEILIDGSDVRLFENAIRPAMKIARLFGLFPRWKLLSTIYASCILALHIAIALTVVHKRFELGYIEAHSAVGFFFYTNSTLVAILFFKLNFEWQKLVNHWTDVEKCIFLTDKYRSGSEWSLRRRLYACTVVGLFAAFMEHTLFIAAGFRKVVNEAEVCGYENDIIAENFFHNFHEHIFSLIPYNHFYGGTVAFLNMSLNFIWSFVDLFIVLVSVGISFRFEQINRRIEFCRGRIAPDWMWCEIRSHYTELCELLRKVDSKMGYLICIASLNDFYFIISQILNASE